nr:GMC family oxidoreductase [Paracoccaceae bacterium]
IRDWVLAEPLDWPETDEDEVGGKHHMGTTRMADDPKRGVVDRDCRVHGLANLYIGGSSVFPSGGHANPTYTVVQLALRLGDHLGRTLGGR